MRWFILTVALVLSGGCTWNEILADGKLWQNTPSRQKEKPVEETQITPTPAPTPAQAREVVAVEKEPEKEKVVEKTYDYSPFVFSSRYVKTDLENAFIPENSQKYLPNLVEQMKHLNYPLVYPQFTAGLIEQETCYSLTHSKCWNPKAELKTSREYGFGLGQITIAYHADGSERFNVFQELKAQRGFENWKWSDRFNPDFQIRGILVKLQSTENILRFDIANDFEQVAFLLAAYNGGAGGVLRDRKLCQEKENCDASKWFDNVELYSTKSKTPLPSYGNRSLFEINRAYAPRILNDRMHKYTWHMQQHF